MRKLGLYLATAFILVALLVLIPSWHVNAANQGLVGTWLVTVTVNTPPGAPPFVFIDLIAFNSGGTLTTVCGPRVGSSRVGAAQPAGSLHPNA